MDLASWRAIPVGREGCNVYVAPSPHTTFGPLPLSPCAGRAGCQRFTPSWATEPGDVVAYKISPRSGYTHFEARRGTFDETARRRLTVIESPAGEAIFAMASREEPQGSCSPDVVLADDGFAVGVVEGDSKWAWFATATWASPQKLAWIEAEPAAIARIRADDRSWLGLRAATPEGLWLGEDSGFSLMNPANGRLRVVVSSRSAQGTYSGPYVAVPGGVVASLNHYESAYHDGIAFYDSKLSAHVLVPPRKGVGVEKLAVHEGNTLLWIEELESGGCRLFRAPLANKAADFSPREVTSLPSRCSLLNGPMLANAGVIVHNAGEPTTLERGELQIVDISTGLGWRVPPPEGRRWEVTLAVTPDAVWASTTDVPKPTARGWSSPSHPELIRLERSSLGAALPLVRPAWARSWR